MARTVKCVVVGDGFVGKTSVLSRYAMNTFAEDHVPTIFDNFTVNILANQEQITLSLWDTPGQEDYGHLRQVSYPATHVFLICFSLVHRHSFTNVKYKWVPEVQHFSPHTPFILVGTKADLRDNISQDQEPTISKDDGTQMAKLIGYYPHVIHIPGCYSLNGFSSAVEYMECSARLSEGVHELFDKVVDLVLNPRTIRIRRKCTLL